jgi:hypothetical protein
VVEAQEPAEPLPAVDRSRNVQKLDRGVSGRFPVVEAEKSAEALPVMCENLIALFLQELH